VALTFHARRVFGQNPAYMSRQALEQTTEPGFTTKGGLQIKNHYRVGSQPTVRYQGAFAAYGILKKTPLAAPSIISI
jgi:hypothetical protein